MTEPIAEKIGVANLETVCNQTNNITIHQGQKVALIYSDPVPDLRLFQGRETELSKLKSWLLEDQTVSIVGVRGEGGIGKSTLTAKMFAECLGFGGKFWADVRTGTSITALAERALQEFGVLPEQVKAIEEKDLIPRLLRQLQQGRYLLAIDNLESVLTTAGDWQSGYASFFEGFQNLGSESVLLLASREYPSKYFGWRRSHWLTLEKGLKPFEGAAMLKHLEVEDTDENRAKVSEQVQGNPLALTLIAGWLREEYRPGERQVNHLSQHTDLLQLEGKHRGETQISVDRVLQWSIDRLSPENQHLLTQVSVLRGAFSAEVAAALVTETIKPSVSDADLDDLERRSLLQALPERNQQGQRMFRLQPRIQEFVQKQADDLSSAHERAIVYFWSHRKTEFSRDDTQAAVNEYEETFYHECQLSRHHDAARTVFACEQFLQRRGYYQLLVDFYSQLHSDWRPTSEKHQDYAGVCNNLGNAYNSSGKFHQAIEFYQQSLEIKRKIGDRNGEVNSLNNLGSAYNALGQPQQAIEFHQQSLEISREVGDRNSEASSLGNLGSAYNTLGQLQRAIDFLQRSLMIKHEIGDRNGEAISLGNLGSVYHALGQLQQAIKFHQQSLEVMRETGDRNGEASSLSNLGSAYNALGQPQQAIKFHQQSLEIMREIGNRNGEANSLNNLGSAYNALGQSQQSIDFYQQSLEISREVGNRNSEANSLGNLGNAYGALGQLQQAINFYQQSLEIMREVGDRSGEASSLSNLGNVYQASKQYQQAIDFYQQSLEITHVVGNRLSEGALLLNMGIALARLDQHYEALQRCQQALTIYQELELDQMVEKCEKAIARCNKLIASQQRMNKWQKWGLWFAVGLVIAIIIWRLQQ